MLTPPQQTPFDAPHPVSKAEPSHHLRETHSAACAHDLVLSVTTQICGTKMEP